jgi:hypothetical protein
MVRMTDLQNAPAFRSNASEGDRGTGGAGEGDGIGTTRP